MSGIVNQVLQSSRLELQPCTGADIDLLLKHWTEPMVRRYLFDDCIIESEIVAQFVAASSASFQKYGYGLWVLFGTDGEFNGVCGLCDRTIERHDLLFSIPPPYWGRGLATESAQCILQYVFDTLGLQQVMATVDQPNIESVRVLEKLEMSLLEERLINGNPMLYYSLTSRDYRTRDAIVAG